MISENIVQESKVLNKFELEEYKKIINYSINIILNIQNQMNLTQFIQIQEEEGLIITKLACTLITSLTKYRSNVKDFNRDLDLLLLEKERKQFLMERIQANLEELRKVIYSEDLERISHFKDLQWRFQVQLSSKTQKNTFKPNILLNIQFMDRNGKVQNNLANCDYANLKNLYQSLNQAMKLHNSNKFNVARKSSV